MNPCSHNILILIEEEEINKDIDKSYYSCSVCDASFRNELEETKMTYDPTKGKEGEDKTQLPKDSIIDGTITEIADGKLPDFVKEEYLKTWQGNTESPAINVTVECQGQDEKVKVTHLFTYMDEDGNTVYAPRSNLGKFVKKYGGLPTIGQAVKIMTNSDGFGKIKLD